MALGTFPCYLSVTPWVLTLLERFDVCLAIPPTSLSLFLPGEYSYLGTTLRHVSIEPMPSPMDVRQLITLYGILPLGNHAASSESFPHSIPTPSSTVCAKAVGSIPRAPGLPHWPHLKPAGQSLLHIVFHICAEVGG